MKIYELYCGDTTTLVAVVDDGGHVISIQTFQDTQDAKDSAISLVEDVLKFFDCGNVQSTAVSIENFLLMHCRVFPEKAS